tara:strand:+ start:572 stop:805 length:234 start_codon:yes stop_codon:yes gene_type:complete
MYSSIITSVFFTSWIIERIYYYKTTHNILNETTPGLLKLNVPLYNNTDISSYVPIDHELMPKNSTSETEVEEDPNIL